MAIQKIIKRKAILLSASLLILASCNTNDLIDNRTDNPPTRGDINFQISIAAPAPEPQTKAATAPDFTTTFEDGDAIGIFAVASGSPLTPSGNHIHNARLTRNGNSWDLDPGITLWWPTSGGTLDFYAYYPYHAEATDPTAITFNVKADQSTAENHNHSHLLTAATSGYGKNQTVPLTFRHALTMIQVSIPGGKGWGDERFSVTLRNVKSGATLNLNNINNTPGNEITLDDDNNPEHITMYRLAEATAGNYIFRALVPAQTIAQGSNLFLFDCAGQALLRDEALTEALTMTAGQADKFTRKIPYPMIETVTIPAGTFLMGSPDTEPYRWSDETQHEVTLTQDFQMSKYEITNAQYVAFLNAAGVGSDGSRLTIQNGQKLINKHPCSVTYNDNETSWVFQSGTEDHPISYVSWYGAKAYTEWVSQTTRTDCRLPTEAQWEYACRAGTLTAFYFGDNYADIGDYEWSLANNTTGGYPSGTKPVGLKKPNPYGLYDMHGNVPEWCADWYDYYPNTAVTDPDVQDHSKDGRRNMRGGSHTSDVLFCRSAFRDALDPSSTSSDVGFRVVVIP